MSPFRRKAIALSICLIVSLPFCFSQVVPASKNNKNFGIQQEFAEWEDWGLRTRDTNPYSNVFSEKSHHLNPVYHVLPGRKFIQGLSRTLENSGKDSKCVSDLKTLLMDFVKQRPYTFAVFDAIGKLPSGIYQGHFTWLGSYDVCTNITVYTNITTGDISKETTDKVRFGGQYCYLETQNPLVPETTNAHFILGFCVPNSCSEDDLLPTVQKGLELALNEFNATNKVINATVQSASITCAVQAPWTGGDIVAILLTSIVVFLAVAGSTYDIVQRVLSSWSSTDVVHKEVGVDQEVPPIDVPTDGKADLISNDTLAHGRGNIQETTKSSSRRAQGLRAFMHQFLMSFSFITNGEKLLGTQVREGQLGAVNGIRVISMWWVILGHTYGFTTGLITNITVAFDFLKRFTFQAISSATVSVDSFFFLSGLLISYLLLKELAKKGGRINWPLLYFHRFWRLTPVYMFLLMLFTTLFVHLPQGPFMRTIDTAAEQCKKYWWANLLYINNFVPTDDRECFGWAWYLANDMQFFLITPVIIYLLYRFKYVSYSIIGFLTLGCLIASGVAARLKYAPAKIYRQPWFRISPYLVGITTGYLLHLWETHGRPRIHKGIVLIGWCLAVVVNMSVVYGRYQPPESYHPVGPDVDALYTSMSRFSWSLGLAWVTFACVTGYGGPVNTLLAWRVWAPLGRLTYCAYLIHPMVMFFYNTSLRRLLYGSDLTVAYLFIAHMVISYALAFVVSLLVEAPMMGLEKLIFHRKKE